MGESLGARDAAEVELDNPGRDLRKAFADPNTSSGISPTGLSNTSATVQAYYDAVLPFAAALGHFGRLVLASSLPRRAQGAQSSCGR